MKIVGRRFRTLEEIYAAVPSANCQGLCPSSCGPIGASRQELRRVKSSTGLDLMAPARKLLTLSTVVAGIPMCPALENDQCSIYNLRPLICRLWGSCTDMPCEFGCEPDRLLSTKESRWLLSESVRLGGKVTVAAFEPTIEAHKEPT